MSHHDPEVFPGPALHTGFLYKRGKGASFFGRKTWKKRWFVLEDQLQIRLGIQVLEPVKVLLEPKLRTHKVLEFELAVVEFNFITCKLRNR